MARIAWALAATLLSTAACDNGKHHLHPDGGIHVDARPDAPPAPWWQPALGTAKDWDIQLAAPFDVSATRVMYDLPLFAVVPAATMIDYGGAMVTFPAGALPTAIADLHGRGAKVICYVDTGAVSTADADYAQFPAAAIGTSVDGGTGPEHFLDIRASSRASWDAKMWKRFDLAKTIGCDGVDAAYNDVSSYTSGFPVMGPENITWYTEVANQLHSRKLSAGMRNGQNISGNVDANATKFDWMIIERCGEHQDCDMARPFMNQQHSVFALDYATDDTGTAQTAAIVCAKQTQGNVSEGIQKDDAITSALRVACDP